VTPAGHRTAQVAHVIDLFPTLVELAGAKMLMAREGRPVLAPQGRSLAPAFHGTPSAEPRALFWAVNGRRAMRHDRWKLVGKPAAWELYDLADDRSESRNLAADHPERVEQMAKAWDEWAEHAANPSVLSQQN
jgi:arylsulfatase A-like enzyme